RCRQLFVRCSLTPRPRAPQPEHAGRLARSRTVTITPSPPNATSFTDAPGSLRIRLNAVVTRTSSSFVGRGLFEQPAACRRGRRRVDHVVRKLREGTTRP